MSVCLCHLCNQHISVQPAHGSHCKGQTLTTPPHQNAEGDLKHKGSGATKSNRGKQPTSCAPCTEGSRKIVFSSQMANKSKCHKALRQWIHMLPKLPSILEPYSLRALWRGSPPNPLQCTSDRQPGIHTYPPLKQNTIPQQVKAITPTHEQDCILSQAKSMRQFACTHPQCLRQVISSKRNQILTNSPINLMSHN